MSKPQDVVNFRKRIKIALVEAFGNKCQVCDKSYPQSVYDFHHLNPAEKKFGIGGQNSTRSRADNAAEAKKCIMVCANCHRLIEYENLDIKGISSIFNEEKYYKKLEELINENKKVVEKHSKSVSKKPSRDELKSLIRSTSFVQIGKRYEVSDNAIRRWCKSYNLPFRVSDIKLISDEDWVNI